MKVYTRYVTYIGNADKFADSFDTLIEQLGWAGFENLYYQTVPRYRIWSNKNELRQVVFVSQSKWSDMVKINNKHIISIEQVKDFFKADELDLRREG